MRFPVNRLVPLGTVIAIVAAGAVLAEPVSVQIVPPTGPAADYPMTVGVPFTIEGTTYKPVDVMNYDAVGYALVEASAGERVSGAHKTLPLPSYVEVTSLDSGKTIVVRMERRGPMTNDRLVGLSSGAIAQLGLTGERPAIRVRRVNPPEQERSALRTGGRVPERMATPKPLLAALLRKLALQEGKAAPVQLPVALPSRTATPAPTARSSPTNLPAPAARLRRPLVPRAVPEPQSTGADPVPKPILTAPTSAPRPVSAPVPAASPQGSHSVQVAAFSTRARADGVAAKLGGQVRQSGKVWRVRIGPFTSQAQADAALAKARRAGYSDARIQRAD